MTSSVEDFRAAYGAALRDHLEQRTETSLSVGHDLGRWALQHRVSVLDVVETHFLLLASPEQRANDAGFQFLLQSLTALDVASRGYLDETQLYRQQRERAEDLAERDAFRRALVESLQDGFFVTDADANIVEVNAAFGDITGYGPEGVPYRWPYPWIIGNPTTTGSPVTIAARAGRFTIQIRHRDGRRLWVAVSSNPLTAHPGYSGMFVGTARDITTERAAAGREQALARLASSIAAAGSVADVFTVALTELANMLGAHQVVAAVWPEETRRGVGYLPSGETDYDSLDDWTKEQLDSARHSPALTVVAIPAAAPGVAAGVVASLSSADDAALVLSYDDPRVITTGDRALVALAVGQLTVALQRARHFDQARTASLTLQRAMLGSVELPHRFAVRYEPAVPPLEIGGDWYDVVTLPDGRISVIVGDCVGRGLAAAAVMGQLRSAGRALLLRGSSPGQLLDELDAVAELIPGAVCTTLCAAVIDPHSGEMRFSNAGHMPPLLCGPDGVTVLEGARAVPLATYDCSPRPEETQILPHGSTLMLYTDGLVERHGESIDTGIDGAARLLEQAAGRSPEDTADHVLAGLRTIAGYDDDVALVIYRQQPADLHISAPAEPAQLALLRAQLNSWLTAAAIPADLASDIVLAANEALTNTIEHAYRDNAGGALTVLAEADSDEVVVTVADTGTWKPPSNDSSIRGRGITMMRALTGQVEIDHSGDGTVVRMATRLTKPHDDGPISHFGETQ